MPRELVVLSPMPVSMSVLARALSAAHPGLALEVSPDRFLATALDDGVRLVTLVHPREVGVPTEVGRLLPPLPEGSPHTLWWTDALVPWGDAEERGVAVSSALAAELGGVLYDPLGGRGATALGDTTLDD
ncbi:MAG: hypothetical protein ABIR17_10700 [Pseudolysinimonas sp.]|uniref:hypothetical protein n=1 Tax=Pseudolysinimonas sp. TaxID=2680009 RepID=UPI0032663F46